MPETLIVMRGSISTPQISVLCRVPDKGLTSSTPPALAWPLNELPDGVMVQAGVERFLIVRGRALQWSPAGYRDAESAIESAMLLTPPSTLRALGAGYPPGRSGSGRLELPPSSRTYRKFSERLFQKSQKSLPGF